MLRATPWKIAIVVATMTVGLSTGRVGAQQKQPSVSSGWVKLPAAGATSADAYVVVENPGMYAFYILSASSDVAGKVEIRETGKDAILEEVTVPAYGALYMDPKGVHLVLKDLKKPLKEGDTVPLTVVNEVGDKMRIDAPVKKE